MNRFYSPLLNQVGVVKFYKKLFEVYYTDSPVGEVWLFKLFNMGIKVSHITRHFSGPYNLSNGNTIRGRK